MRIWCRTIDFDIFASHLGPMTTAGFRATWTLEKPPPTTRKCPAYQKVKSNNRCFGVDVAQEVVKTYLDTTKCL